MSNVYTPSLLSLVSYDEAQGFTMRDDFGGIDTNIKGESTFRNSGSLVKRAEASEHSLHSDSIPDSRCYYYVHTIITYWHDRIALRQSSG
jgi:hypothetical protein